MSECTCYRGPALLCSIHDAVGIGLLNKLNDMVTPDPCPRCSELQAEVDHWRGLYEVERGRRTLGGTPLKPGERWTNVELPIGEGTS